MNKIYTHDLQILTEKGIYKTSGFQQFCFAER